MARADTDNYRELFLRDTPLIDTRAPVEFERGAFPGAVNLPLLDDEERAQVGTCYKHHGQRAALRLGHELVHGGVRDQRVEAWRAFARRHPDGYLYCFRGGMRSEICQQWLREAGCDYPRVIGGYKAMRRFLINTLEWISREQPLLILAGHTGSAKTEMLRRLEGSVDLEGLARHRGSAFGKRVGGQPGQIDFENALAIDLLRRRHESPERPVLLEDEGHLIGRRSLPLVLREAMNRAPLVVLESDLESRTEHSFRNYILDNLSSWQALEGEARGFERFADQLHDSLYRVRKRLGGQRYRSYQALMEQALEAHRQGNPDRHREWIRGLLEQYYDPMYRYQLEQKRERVILQGGPDTVERYLREVLEKPPSRSHRKW